MSAPDKSVSRSIRDHQIDLGIAIDGAHWAAYQKRVLVLIALAFAVDGIANQALGLAIPSIAAEWQLQGAAFAWVAGAGLIGVTIGAAAGGVLGDRFGRRPGLIGSVLVFGMMTLAAAYVSNLNQLLLVRFIDGLGIGAALPNGAALIAEFTPKKRRSLAIALGMMCIPLGAFLASAIATIAIAGIGWRGYFLVVGAVAVFLGLLFVVALPESPLLLSRRPGRRSHLLAMLGRMGILVPDGSTFIDSTHAGKRIPLAMLLEARTLRDTLALWSGFFFCLLASYTMFNWAPTMLAGQGLDVAKASIGMGAFSLGGVFGGLLGGYLITRLGSQRSVLGLAAGASVGALVLGALTIAGTTPSFGVLLIALSFEGACIAGLTNGAYTLATHIYPPFAKATGVGAAAAAGRLGAIASSYTGVLALQLGGASAYFLVIAIACALSLVCIAQLRDHVQRIAS